jgi:2-polyprenyl-3-methyl-5-hydroxy-6-metoxy-1,4-benzoquinol methylase
MQNVSGRHAAMPKRAPIVESYDRYYGSGLYDARYPRPNPPTYRSALRLARTAARILDFGAGSGRYTMPFLRATNAFVCAYDISADACKALELQAATANAGRQRLLITADLDAVRAAGPYDLVVALFGVLSHIEGKENRIDILSSIRSLLSREGLLLLTVPMRFAAFPCTRQRMVAAAKAAVRLRLGRRRAVTFPRHGRLSIAITSRMRRGRFLTTYSHGAS